MSTKFARSVARSSTSGRASVACTKRSRVTSKWRRYKGFWRGQFAEGSDPGLTYRRDSVEVAFKTTSPDDARDEELRTIRRLQPRDNQIGQPDIEPELEAVPF